MRISKKLLERLAASLDKEFTYFDEPLAPYTTLRIGGLADIFFRAASQESLVKAIKFGRKFSIPITILGWGSNILVGDKGIRGLVIHNETGGVRIQKAPPKADGKNELRLGARWQADKTKGTFKYEFGDLDYGESEFPRVKVTVESGVVLPKLINTLLDDGITGLQWFARIPGTIGGAVFNNIHGGTHFFSEFVGGVRVLTPNGEMKWLSSKELGLDYDKSRFHNSGEIILCVELNLFRGDKERAKATALEWARRKNLQPPRSAGCTFENISNEDKEKLKLPTTSAGYVIEHILKLGGYRIGGAMVSTAHHNFIVNAGGATAKDYLTLVKLIQKETKKKLGIKLESEIIFLGEF